MNIIIAGGTGFIGASLTHHFLKQNNSVTIISRNKQKIHHLFGSNVNALSWEELNLQGQQAIKFTDVIINLTGVSIGDKRWSQQRKDEILYSRLVPTQLLTNLCAQLGNNAPALFNASAIGIYGLQSATANTLPAAVDESQQINFNGSTSDFLSYVGQQWELATHLASKAGVRVVNLRFAVVLGKHGGALAKLKLPFLLGLGGPIGSGYQPFSWIAMTDLINAVDFLIKQKTILGPVNLVAPNCINQRQFAQALGNVLHRPSFLPMPGFMVKALFGEMGDELLLHGQHVKPTVLLQNGFKFQYPDIASALKSVFTE